MSSFNVGDNTGDVESEHSKIVIGSLAVIVDGCADHVFDVEAASTKISDKGILCGCTPGACGNVEPIIPLTCTPPCGTSPNVNLVAPMELPPSKAAPLWSSLFSKLLNDAGVHTPRCFDDVEIDEL